MKRRNFLTATILSIPVLSFAGFSFSRKKNSAKSSKKGFVVRADESRYYGEQSSAKDAFIHCKISTTDTDEKLLIQTTTPKSAAFKGGPPPHYHHYEDETLYVVSGAFVVHMDGEDFTLKAGDTAFIPKGTLHTITNPIENNPGSFITIFQPAPKKVEDFFHAISLDFQVPKDIHPEGWE